MALLWCAKMQVDKVYSKAEFERCGPSASRCKKEGRCLRFEHIRLSYLPQSFQTR
ncbi:hypothetical protein Gotur_025581 [Gossypium turneri]